MTTIGVGLVSSSIKNPSFTSAKDSVKIECISKGQPSPYTLAFRVELGAKPHFKMVFKSYPKSIKRNHPLFHKLRENTGEKEEEKLILLI